MADRTPRFMWQNLIQLAGTSTTASSANAAFPKAWTQDPQPTKVWRSKTGWNVVVGFNDKLDFSEAGVARLGTLTAGNYADGATFAAHVQTQMNAAPGATNTYTVTYSTSTYKFTITRATGANALVMKWNTGANVSAGCATELGFATSADSSGGATYTSTNSAYHSKENVRYDLGSALDVSTAIVTGHAPVSSTGAIKIQGNATDAWTAPTVNTSLVGDDRILVLFIGSTNTLRYWRFVIDDTGNSLGYSALGVPYVGTYLQPGRSVRIGYSENSDDLSIIVEGDQGAFFQNKKPRRKRWDLVFPRLNLTDKNAIDSMQDFLGVGRPLYFSLDPANTPSETRYGIFDRPFGETHTVGDGNPPDRWNISVSFVEAVG